MANEAADATSASAPRRSSRRESRASSPAPSTVSTVTAAVVSPAASRVDNGDAAVAVVALTAEQEPLDSSGGSTRRSRRQVKSTYATHTLASPSALTTTAPPVISVVSPRPSPRKAMTQPKEKKSAAVKPEPAVVLVTVPIEENERISKRRRPHAAANATSGASTSASANVGTTEVVVKQAVAAVKVPAVQPEQSVKSEPSFAQPPTGAQQVADTDIAVTATDISTEAPTQAAPASPPPRSSTAPVAATAAAAPNSANRRRRPASRQTVTTSGSAGNLAGSLTSSLNAVVTPMGDADVSARTQGERKVLGKYTGRECTLLCEAILLQIKRNSQDPKVLERDHSPAHIRWDKISQKMLKAHRLAISPRDAQELWKFLAYAELPAPAKASQCNALTSTTSNGANSNEGGQGQSAGATTADTMTAVVSLEDQLLPASDTEDYCQSVQTINEKYKKRATRTITSEELQPTTSATVAASDQLAMKTKSQVDEAISMETQVQPTELSTADPVQSLPAAAGPASPVTKAAGVAQTTTHPGSRFRLYPAYDQPSGIPESWLKDKPFNVKETLPFTFVADKFLKKKPGAVVPAAPTDSGPKSSTAAVATPTAPGQAVSASGSTPADGADKPKKKRARKTENAKPKAAADGSTPSESAKPKKPRVAAQKSLAGLKATVTPPKSPYVPSSTPPPQPLPPRAAFQFFCRMHEEVVASAAGAAQLALSEAAAIGTTATSATAPAASPPVKKKTYFELQELFASATLEVRNACQKLALEDLDRYNRECVRRRIWEKAMSNSPVTSPQSGAIAASIATPIVLMQPSSKPPASIPSLTVPVAIAGAPAPVTSVTAPKVPAPSAVAPAPSTQ